MDPNGDAAKADSAPDQHPRRKGYHECSWVSRWLFAYVGPMLRDAAQRPLEEHDAEWMCPPSDYADAQAKQFNGVYLRLKAYYAPRPGAPRPFTTVTGLALAHIYWWPLVQEAMWTLIEVAQRLGTPVALREFLRWLQAYNSAEPAPPWKGWLWALVLGAAAFTMCIIHHQMFWLGMRAGFGMRQQVIAAVHSKVLHLNAASVSALSTGHVVNLVSNDVRRFDDAMPFWVFLWAGPLELIMVFIMVALELDWLSSLAGVATSLAMIPLQSFLVRYIGGLRRNTAKCTDERVRLAGEVIEGALAMKMLSWEDPFTSALHSIRARETHYCRRMARIRALNFAMQFCITPIVSFATFAVYRARSGTLNVPSVFYALSLLHLPKLYMINFFVLAVQTLTELRVSLQRIDAFLSQPEPQQPSKQDSSVKQQQQRHSASRGDADGAPAAAPEAAAIASGGTGSVAPLPAATAGWVAMGGADYDWLRPFGNDELVQDTHGTALGTGRRAALSDAAGASTPRAASSPRKAKRADSGIAKAADSAIATAAGSSSGALTLYGLTFTVPPGQVLGICGEVGSGKSSVLAALLGELQPLRPNSSSSTTAAAAAGTADSAAAAAAVASTSAAGSGPVLVGTVAYCAQVPWILAGTVRENIVFGSAWDERWYERTLVACCLTDDLAGLPAGDGTELGERGVNLSGGQKARVALARACYARPSIALLDDPLSAVDPRVGRELFSRAIGPGGLLDECGTTRLLVTHQRQYLPRCERVMVLQGGRMAALGPWPEVAALQLRELTAGHGGSGGEGDAAAVEHDVTVDELTEATAQGAGPLEDAAVALAAAGGSSETPMGAHAQEQEQKHHHQQEQLERRDEGLHGGRDVHDDGKEYAAETTASAAVAIIMGKAHTHSTPPRATSSEASASDAASSAVGADVVVLDVPNGVVHLPPVPTPRAAAAGSSAGTAPAAAGGAAPDGASASAGPSTPRMMMPDDDAGTNGRKAALFLTSPGASNTGQAYHYQLTMARTFGGLGRGLRAMHSGISRLNSGKLVPSPTLQEQASQSADATAAGKLVSAEDRVTGSVSWRVYGNYCNYLGLLLAGLITLTMFGGQAVFLASEWWLALWAKARPDDQKDGRWLIVYGILTATVIVVAAVRCITFFEATLNAATAIHNAMARCVLRAPLSFFHTNPTGRIVNRFSKDQGQVDDLLPMTLYDALQCGFLVSGALVLVSIAVPVILPVFVPLALAFYWVRRRYISASREIKRWEAVTRSPVYASFSATLKGLPTIRAYGAADRFHDSLLELMTINCKWYFAFLSTSRWIGVRLDAVSASTLLASALLAVAMRDSVQPQILALALTHVLQLTGMMQWFVRQTAEVENNMTCVERMLAYTELPCEPPRVAEGGKAPPAGWPHSGELTYQDVTAVYRPGLPPVLRSISFHLPAGTSCGVVGRTGSGKSSLMLTLYRLIDVTHGSILLDGVDTAGLGLDALRKQLAIIPQDPVLFSGTLRSNLDPWGSHDDARLWGVLEAVQLKAPVQAMPGGLDARMAECGDNLSVGQRQLFCLARALLQDARVLALDEATANVDRATDALIQSALRDFAHADPAHGRVLLVIAHRLETVLDCDALLVLAAGELVEFGAPAELAARPGGTFARMAAAAKHVGVAAGARAGV